MKNKRKTFLILLIMWFVINLIASLAPSSTLPIDKLLGFDKLLHLIKYMIFIVILYNYLHYSDVSYKIKLGLYIPLLFFPFVDESLQLLVPSRSFSHADIIADYLGVFAGMIICGAIRVLIHKKGVTRGLNK